MSQRYTPDEKNRALQRLDDNFGNITLTAMQTGISKRTLQDWRAERRLRAFQNGEPDPEQLLREKNIAQQQQQNSDPQSTREANEYVFIRERLLQHIHTLLENLIEDPDTAHLRINALSRLLDRVIKLESLVFAHTREHVIRIEYAYDGGIHNVPPWLKDESPTAAAEEPFTDYNLT